MSVLAVRTQGSLGQTVQVKEEVTAGLSEQQEPWDKSPLDSTSRMSLHLDPFFHGSLFFSKWQEIYCLKLTATFLHKMEALRKN